MGASCWCCMTLSTRTPVCTSLTMAIGWSFDHTGGTALATWSVWRAPDEIDLGIEPFQRRRYSTNNRRAHVGETALCRRGSGWFERLLGFLDVASRWSVMRTSLHLSRLLLLGLVLLCSWGCVSYRIRDHVAVQDRLSQDSRTLVVELVGVKAPNVLLSLKLAGNKKVERTTVTVRQLSYGIKSTALAMMDEFGMTPGILIGLPAGLKPTRLASQDRWFEVSKKKLRQRSEGVRSRLNPLLAPSGET